MTMQLHSDASGLVHYLDEKPVHSGDIIEVFLHGNWSRVQYEWSGKAGTYAFGIINPGETTVTLKPDTRVRWPEK